MRSDRGTAKGGRTLIVGDVHGCPDELDALLESVGYAPRRDRLVLVGDVVVRGPDSRRALRRVVELGATIVRGNHEQKLLAGHAGTVRLGPEHQPVADAFSSEDWRTLEGMPLWLDLPEHDLRVVHAGVVPGVEITRTPRDALLRMRTIDAQGQWSDARDGGTLWGALYEGPPHVVFGHHARPSPQLHPWATGIDTGCVYGQRLTGLLLEADETVPRGDDAHAKLVQVPARRAYYRAQGRAP
jgi:Calcineurin-like phosphoesterase